MTIGYRGTIDALVSHALASGMFGSVNGHEPKSAPAANQITCAVWVQRFVPYPEGSALANVTGTLTVMVRLYAPSLAEPADAIDPDMMDAADVLMAAYAGHFTLGGNVRNIDLLGEASGSQGLTLNAGYLTQDSRQFRVLDITLPMVINDVWQEAP